jgi:hypothetical protein
MVRVPLTYQIVDLISVAGEVFVYQIKWVPAEKDVFIVDFALAEGSKGLVHEVADIELHCWFETFFLHPVSTVPTGCEAMLSTDLLQILNDLRANKITLARVR